MYRCRCPYRMAGKIEDACKDYLVRESGSDDDVDDNPMRLVEASNAKICKEEGKLETEKAHGVECAARILDL